MATTSIKSAKSAESVRKAHSREIASAQKQQFIALSDKSFSLVNYDFDEKHFILKYKENETEKTLKVPSWYLKPIKPVADGINLKKLTPEEAQKIDYESFEGKLSTIDKDNLDTFSVECEGGEVVEIASLDCSIFNKLKSLNSFKLKITEKNALIWSAKKERYYNIATYILVVE